MIQQQCFTIDWIRRQGAIYGCRNLVMLEKATMALELLAHLAESGIQFQFKGGTSLLLRLNPLRRLSIDVDIVTQADPDAVRQVMESSCRQNPFAGYEHDDKRDRDLPPKKHYRVMYPSVVENRNDHILLDVLFEPEAIPGCEPIPIRVPFIETLREVRVDVPSVNHLLGDKLTAFAPTTIGILYHPDRKTDIVKQLFDVGALFDSANDLRKVAAAYEHMHRKQLAYGRPSCTLDDALNDTIRAGFEYSQVGLRGGSDSENARSVQEGVRNLENHLLNQPFAQTEARIAAAKAACLAAWLQRRPAGVTFAEIRFDPKAVEELRDKRISRPWGPLDRLKGGNPEAFHYWHKAQHIMTSLPEATV